MTCCCIASTVSTNTLRVSKEWIACLAVSCIDEKSRTPRVDSERPYATPSGFERTGSLNTPPTVWLNAVANLRAKHMRGRGRLAEYLSKLNSLPDFTREAASPDALFSAAYGHKKGAATCKECDPSYVADRGPRKQEIVVHYGTIASGNQVMRSAAERDQVSVELSGVLCFEMEAAGLINSFPCLVIRGICDYSTPTRTRTSGGSRMQQQQRQRAQRRCCQ
jgi:hypothetical protein